MDFGSTERDRYLREAAWLRFRFDTRRRPYLAEIAERWAELIEQAMRSRKGVHVRHVAAKMLDSARGNRPLSTCEIAIIVRGLFVSWRYGLSLRNWALSYPGLNDQQRYIQCANCLEVL